MNWTFTKSIYLLLIIFLVSCSTESIKQLDELPTVFLDGKLEMQLLPPMSTDMPISLTQSVLIKHNNQQHQFISKLEISDKSFKMVGVTPIGLKLFSIYSNGNSFVFETNQIAGSDLNIKYLLADLQLTYWPVEKLNQRLLASSAVIKSDGHSRQLLRNNEIIIDIQFNNKSRWEKQINFKHLKRNYTVHIQTLSIEKL